jgi:hypothetical protein
MQIYKAIVIFNFQFDIFNSEFSERRQVLG